jgi:hypothetical protein
MWLLSLQLCLYVLQSMKLGFKNWCHLGNQFKKIWLSEVKTGCPNIFIRTSPSNFWSSLQTYLKWETVINVNKLVELDILHFITIFDILMNTFCKSLLVHRASKLLKIGCPKQTMVVSGKRTTTYFADCF